jgi:hypothetical protein
MNKLDWLRAQADAYWRHAEAAPTEKEALRLVALAMRCQEQILELQQCARLKPLYIELEVAALF